jgi:5-methylcytosine-specific restriction endonuclease McrA
VGRHLGRLKRGAHDQVKAEVCERQRWRCGICNGETPNPELHHIQPISAGGNNKLRNLIGLCEGCHDIVDAEWQRWHDKLRKYTKARDRRAIFGADYNKLKPPPWAGDERYGK